ncbi:MAG: putative MPP superfamily phosphohydrolase [Pseudohongiellaceae bacterium]
MRDVSKPPRRYSWLTLLVYGAVRWVLEHCGGRAFYRWRLGRGGLTVVQLDVCLPDLPPELDGLRAVQISDLHAGPFLDERALDPVVELVVAHNPQLLFVTGDLITDTVDDRQLLGDVFGRLPAPLGKFAVFGNHDYRQRREGELVHWLRRQGVRTLRNSSAAVQLSGATVRVMGLEDLEEGKLCDLDGALAEGQQSDDLTVLLCHHPAVLEQLPSGRFDLVLCGHSHGGQIVLPVLGPIRGRGEGVPAESGGALGGGGWWHVNRGLGVLLVPFRFRAPAEVTWITFRRGSGQGSSPI